MPDEDVALAPLPFAVLEADGVLAGELGALLSEEGALLGVEPDIVLGAAGAGAGAIVVVELLLELGGVMTVVDGAGAGAAGAVTLMVDGVAGLLLS